MVVCGPSIPCICFHVVHLTIVCRGHLLIGDHFESLIKAFPGPCQAGTNQRPIFGGKSEQTENSRGRERSLGDGAEWSISVSVYGLRSADQT
jgi:hypothetical protein